MKEFLWKIKEQPSKKQVDSLVKSLGVHPALASVLVQRKIDDFEKAKAFFRPSLDDLHDPFEMKGMLEAVMRITSAIEQKEEIMVYGDYDVDGTTAVSALSLYLKRFFDHVHYYIPDRYKEGYGISKDGIDTALELDCKVIIALDCGIKAIEIADYAASKGIDLIICDHHIPGENLPKAHAILNPKQDECKYPFKELSGCGIGFKLMQALDSQIKNQKNHALDFLDLVMVSIAADIVPIIGENRILAFYGLKKIKEDPSTGLKALMEVSGLDQKKTLTISSIVFGIAPRINAAGRMKHGFGAVQVLVARDMNEALERSQYIHDQNTLRRHIDEETTLQALREIQDTHPDESFCSVVYHEDWHQGVLGIVASRCIEKFYRPTIILTKKGDQAVGSARSIQEFDLYSALEKCSDLFLKWGGHEFAAGISMPINKIPEFRSRLDGIIKERLQGRTPTPSIEVDALIEFKGIDRKFYSVLSQMEPFGPGNMKPVFLSKGVKHLYSPRILKELHLKARIYQEEKGIAFDCIGFKKFELREILEREGKKDMVFTVFENNYMGDSKLELEIKDIKPFSNGIKGRKPDQEI